MVELTESPASARAKRLLFIDGLRGLAAMAVVGFHFAGHLRDPLAQWFSPAISWILFHGYLGVPVFFVISGYVITLTAGSGPVSISFIARFAFRRSIRLDPPYWVAIAFAISLAALAQIIFPDLHKTSPTWPQILSHLFYLQNILGYGDIVDVFWTLCFEVQFYAFLLIQIYALQSILKSQKLAELLQNPLVMVGILSVIGLSLADFTDVVPIELPGVFLPYWFCFALGMMSVWKIQRLVSTGWWLASIGLVAAALIWGGIDAWIIASLVTTLLLHLANRLGKMSTWLAGRTFQFLGKISYSLYLFHGIIGWSAISLFKRMWPGELTPVGTVAAFCFGITVSIGLAWVVYVLVEKPSIILSRRVSLGERSRNS